MGGRGGGVQISAFRSRVLMMNDGCSWVWVSGVRVVSSDHIHSSQGSTVCGA